jgi:hypothetical protein
MLVSVLLGAALAAPPVPVHSGSHPCMDRDYPRMDGALLVACDRLRRPTVRIDPVTLESTKVESGPDQPIIDTLVPPMRMGSRAAVSAYGVAWVAAGAEGRRELWWRAADKPLPIALEVGAADPHHPVSDGKQIAWVSAGRIKTFDPTTGDRSIIEAQTGFHSPPSYHLGVLCWETRTGKDVDIACSDGLKLERSGHQTRPIRTTHRLFFMENGMLWAWDMSP